MATTGLAEKKKIKEPVLKLNFMSHGTLESGDLERTRKFYEEFLGLEVMRTSPVSLLARLGGRHTYAVVYNKRKKDKMSHYNHNGLDVSTQEEVDECHRLVNEHAETWGLHEITQPRLHHGTYSFFFRDMDENCWEILTNADGGYTWLFEQGDLEGKGHQDRRFKRPGVNIGD